jgi:hypothetical protein
VGQRPPVAEYIKKEEAKLQRGRTYIRPNQWLGNEKGLAKKIQQIRLQGLGREERATKRHYNESYRALNQSLIEG